ncbi:MAG: hypothetical protein LQ350_008008 [Teloschistes chrysophthalmus]|nr:MAG: hypothetical protein LQ350_008008 [Niorma chrysophthalma]
MHEDFSQATLRRKAGARSVQQTLETFATPVTHLQDHLAPSDTFIDQGALHFYTGQTWKFPQTKRNSEPVELSPIDNIAPRRHTHKLLLFPVTDPDLHALKVLLIEGLTRVFDIIPSVAGSIAPCTATSGQRGRSVVTGPFQTAEEALTFQDYRDREDFDYQPLRERGFPTHQWTNKSILSPLPPLTDTVQPVFRATITLVNGGLILVSAVHHSFTDGSGSATISRLWTTSCLKEPLDFDPNEFRRKLVVNKNVSAQLEEFPYLTYTGTMDSPLTRFITSLQQRLSSALMPLWNIIPRYNRQSDSPSVTNKPQTVLILFFSAQKLELLKSMIAPSKGAVGGSSWISTQDALFSLLFCAIMTARRSCMRASGVLYNGSEEAALGVVRGARQLTKPPLSPNHIGNVLLLASVKQPLDQVNTTSERISTLAYSVRDAIKLKTTDYMERYLAALSSVEDISKVTVAGRARPELILWISSWRDQDFYNQPWDRVFGTGCERLRFFGSIPPGIAVVLPEIKDSPYMTSAPGLEVALGAHDDILPYLKGDEMLNRFAEWRCESRIA